MSHGADPLAQRPLGRTGYSVTPLCFGTSPLGLPHLYGAAESLPDAVATIHAVLDGPLNFIDSANGYGDSERQIGEALAQRHGLPPGCVLATKVDPAPGTAELSGARVRASVTESLERLGLDRLQLVHLHDPERLTFAEATGAGGAVEALVSLREQGVIGHLGVAGFDSALLRRYLQTGEFDVVLSHNQFTLIDQGAAALFDDAVSRGIAVLNAAPYGGGMLAKGPSAMSRYGYGIDSDSIRRRAAGMLSVCRQAGVPLAAAALQFSMRDSRVTSTVVGMRTAQRLAQTVQLASWPIDDALWDSLGRLISAGATSAGSDGRSVLDQLRELNARRASG